MADLLLQTPITTITGEQKTLADYPAKAWLIVNTASRCGYTPQYRGLEQLWDRYRDLGLVVLGFPCNQFGKQEPAPESEIAQFCEINFGVSFPLFSKVEVNGPAAHPLFAELKRRAPGVLGSQAIKWNFTKFLVSQQGAQVQRFATLTKPAQMAAAIEAVLA